MLSLTSLALSLLLVAVFFYVLYFVVRAAVRDGMKQASGPDGIDRQELSQPRG